MSLAMPQACKVILPGHYSLIQMLILQDVKISEHNGEIFYNIPDDYKASMCSSSSNIDCTKCGFRN